MILVFGATGKVGRHLVDLLAALRVETRALTRDPARAKFPADVQAVAGDASDDASLARALDGVTHVFFMAPDHLLPEHAHALVAAAPKAGVRHVAMLSSLSVEMEQDNPLAATHREAEEILVGADFEWTLLRGGQFASNTLGWAPSIRNESIVRCLTRNDPVASVDLFDIAAVAAAVLTEDGHRGMTYGLTGGEAITPAQQTEILAGLLGRAIEFLELSYAEAHAIMVPRYADRAEGEAKLQAIRRPDLPWNAARPDVEEVLGRPARSYRDWARDNIEAFR